MNITHFKKLPLMGIVRGLDIDDIEPLFETVIGAGLKTIEITMNTPGVAEIISKSSTIANDRITIGAGTVLSLDEAKRALDAGASFIVMPVCIKEVVDFCTRKDVPVFPGALTPKEVLDAWKLRAAMVKVFPARVFGPKYLKELKGPFDKIELMAVGGINLQNIAEYFSNGADAVAFGSSVFKKEWIAKKDFAAIGKLVSEYVREVKRVNCDL